MYIRNLACIHRKFTIFTDIREQKTRKYVQEQKYRMIAQIKAKTELREKQLQRKFVIALSGRRGMTDFLLSGGNYG